MDDHACSGARFIRGPEGVDSLCSWGWTRKRAERASKTWRHSLEASSLSPPWTLTLSILLAIWTLGTWWHFLLTSQSRCHERSGSCLWFAWKQWSLRCPKTAEIWLPAKFAVKTLTLNPDPNPPNLLSTKGKRRAVEHVISVEAKATELSAPSAMRGLALTVRPPLSSHECPVQ